MRLRKYITEMTEVDPKDIELIMNSALSTFKKKLAKEKFRGWPIVLRLLKGSFKPYNIEFFHNDQRLRKYDNVKKVDYAMTDIITSKIILLISTKELQSIKKPSDASKIKRKFTKILAHEITHAKQFKAMGTEYRKKLASTYNEDEINYYSDPNEIEAYARQALDELEAGKDDVVTTYIDHGKKKVWRNFIKKVYQYIDIYGSEKARKNLVKILDIYKNEIKKIS